MITAQKEAERIYSIMPIANPIVASPEFIQKAIEAGIPIDIINSLYDPITPTTNLAPEIRQAIGTTNLAEMTGTSASMPSWILPVGLGLLAVVMLK